MTTNIEPDLGGLSYNEIEGGVVKCRNTDGGTQAEGAKREGLGIFRPELLNSIDEMIVFNSLDIEAIRQLLKNTLDETLSELQKKHHVSLRLSKDAEMFLAHAGYSPEYGARELKRIVRQFIYVPLSGLILSGELARHKRWLAVYDENGISIVPDEEKK